MASSCCCNEAGYKQIGEGLGIQLSSRLASHTAGRILERLLSLCEQRPGGATARTFHDSSTRWASGA